MKFWGILGVAILAGHMVLTLIRLTIVFIISGCEEFVATCRERWVLRDTKEEVAEYVETLKEFKGDLER